MGQWRGGTFKEYIHEKLADFTVGISRDMKTRLNFVNVAGGAYHNVTEVVVEEGYRAGASMI